MNSTVWDFWSLCFLDSPAGIWTSELKQPLRTDIPIARQYALLTKHALLTQCNRSLAILCGCERPAELEGIPLIHLFSHQASSANALVKFLQTKCSVLPWTLSRTKGPDGKEHLFEDMCIGRLDGARLMRIWGMRRIASAETLEIHRVRTIIDSLSSNQRRILELTACGKTLKEIGARLSLSINTVESYRFRSLRKLGFHSVAEFILRAGSLGLYGSKPEEKKSVHDFHTILLSLQTVDTTTI
ncbi:MAG: hypothetical protein HBSIN02_15700 [Bacteroidia bacterium]|nr:MAG: hypothetical protein HBSIN02_15700 [Bacteroidia bacterium]